MDNDWNGLWTGDFHGSERLRYGNHGTGLDWIGL